MDKRLTELFWECVSAPFIPPPEIPDKCNFKNKLEHMRLKNYNQRIVEILSDPGAIDVIAGIAKSDFQKVTITQSIDILIEQRRAGGIYNELYERII